jgi:hypothetical protein
MFARNNVIPPLEPGATIRPAEALTWSFSRDGGATWTPHAFVPLETVVSRMHLLRQPDSDRILMLHNDWPAGRFCADRRNLALFVNRGGGIDFTAGIGLTEREHEVAYPQMDIHDNALLFTYSQGFYSLRNIRAVRVSPLPDPDQLLPLPAREPAAAAALRVMNGALVLRGGPSLRCRAAPAVAADRVQLAAEANLDQVAYFSTTAARPAALSGHQRQPVSCISASRPRTCVQPYPCRADAGSASRSGRLSQGRGVFTVNDASERVVFKPGRRSLASASATLFGPQPRRQLAHVLRGCHPLAYPR